MMSVVVAVFVVVGAVLVLLIAVGAVGAVVGRLSSEPPRNVFDGEEALAFVAEALPTSLTAILSYEDVQRILRLHLDYLHERGVARSGGDLAVGDADDDTVLDADGGVAWVLERAALVDFFPAEAEVRAVIEAQYAYFEAIGAAVEVGGPDDPETS